MKTWKTITVILLAIISFSGIIYVQYQWLSDSLTTNRQLFLQKVDLGMSDINQAVRSDAGFSSTIVNELHDREALSPETDGKMHQFIDSVLVSSSGINTTFKYGIYKHGPAGAGFVKLAGDAEQSLLSFEHCSSSEKDFGWIRLAKDLSSYHHNYTGTNHFDYHLAVFFPDDLTFILANMRGSLFTSAVFLLLLVGCFFYTLWTIGRQKRLSALKNDFINNLTHEFKTPIFSIDLAAGMLKNSEEITGDEKLKTYVDVISTEGKRLKNQVDKVLQMALVDSGNFRLEKKEVDLHDLIRVVVKNFELTIRERQGEIHLNLHAADASLMADETHLKNIIYNLLDNAQKYTKDNPNITITTRNETGGLLLQIADNGIGIDDHVQRFIFDKFYRVNRGDIHDVKGFGLGLSYVKSVIDAHQATIKIMSKPHFGSTFTMQFNQ